MVNKKCGSILCMVGLLAIFSWVSTAHGRSDAYKENIYPVGKLKPTDSVLKVKVGDRAPDFTLPAVQGNKVTLNSSLTLCKPNIILNLGKEKKSKKSKKKKHSAPDSEKEEGKFFPQT